MSPKKVVILGVGGYCANLIDIMRDINTKRGQEIFEPVGYLDDDTKKHGIKYFGLDVMGGLKDAAARFPDAYFVNGIGSAETAWKKQQIIDQVGASKERFVTLVHPSAWVAPTVTLGAGSVVAQYCVVMAGAVIGDHVKMLPQCTISYGSNVGSYSTVSTGAVTLSDVVCGVSNYLGANVSIKERVKVGDHCILGMGTVVLKDVPANSVMVGNPARFLRHTRPA